MKSDVGSLALLDIFFSHGEESVFEMHLRLGPWMVYFLLFLGSLGLRDLPFVFEDQCINFAILAQVRCLLFLWCIWNRGAFFCWFYYLFFFVMSCLHRQRRDEPTQGRGDQGPADCEPELPGGSDAERWKAPSVGRKKQEGWRRNSEGAGGERLLNTVCAWRLPSKTALHPRTFVRLKRSEERCMLDPSFYFQ